MKRKSLITLRLFFPLLFLAFSVSGCFEDREDVFEGRLLEWEPPNRATNELSAHISLGVDESEPRTIPLRIQYAGPHTPDPLTAVFEVAESESSAVEGEHFTIEGDKSLTIPANSSHSEQTEVTILSGAVPQGESLEIVLRITEASSVPPMANYRDFVITVSKDAPPSLEAIQVRLDRPGYNASPNMLDVINGETHSRNDARADANIQSQVDFGMWSGSTTGYNIILPASDDRIGSFGSGRIVRDEWVNKNDGVLMKLPADNGNRDLFEGLETEEDILAAYEAAEDKLDELGLDASENGPGQHIAQLEAGELIFFHSTDRNIYMVAIVAGIDNESGAGYADLDIKRIVHSAD